MSAIEVALRDYIAESTRHDFVWGAHDCTTFVCDWAHLVTGRDPHAPWRGGYSSGAGAAAQLAIAGGLESALDYGLSDRCGFLRTDAPVRGDIGLILLGRPVCAIRADGLWAAHRRRGVVLQDAPSVAAWSLQPSLLPRFLT